ncbi:MAG: lysoplasmalogenase [Pseudomonadota bacterium]
MTVTAWLLFGAAVALAATYAGAYVRARASVARSAAKTGAVLGLAVAAFLVDAPAFLIVALLCCAVGDYFLSRDGDVAFMTGVAAFAAGHLAYVALFLSTAKDGAELPTIGVFALAWLLLILGLVMATLLWSRAGQLRVPVLIYIPIILGMGWAALSVPMSGPLAAVLPAALIFVASDITLAVEKFLLPQMHPARAYTPYVIWTTYWSAQAMFTLAYTL